MTGHEEIYISRSRKRRERCRRTAVRRSLVASLHLREYMHCVGVSLHTILQKFPLPRDYHSDDIGEVANDLVVFGHERSSPTVHQRPDLPATHDFLERAATDNIPTTNDSHTTIRDDRRIILRDRYFVGRGHHTANFNTQWFGTHECDLAQSSSSRSRHFNWNEVVAQLTQAKISVVSSDISWEAFNTTVDLILFQYFIAPLQSDFTDELISGFDSTIRFTKTSWLALLK